MANRCARSILVPLAAAVVLTACGGGGGGGDSGLPSVTKHSIPSRDGVVSNTGFDVRDGTTVAPFTGDLGVAGVEYRQYFDFNTHVSDTARIVRATLYAYQVDVVGEPYDKKGVIVIDLVRFLPGADASYSGDTHLTNVATLCTTPTPGLYSADVTDAVLHEQEVGYYFCGLRLRFYSPVVGFSDSITDHAVFVDGEDAAYDTGQPARLVIEYVE